MKYDFGIDFIAALATHTSGIWWLIWVRYTRVLKVTLLQYYATTSVIWASLIYKKLRVINVTWMWHKCHKNHKENVYYLNTHKQDTKYTLCGASRGNKWRSNGVFTLGHPPPSADYFALPKATITNKNWLKKAANLNKNIVPTMLSKIRSNTTWYLYKILFCNLLCID